MGSAEDHNTYTHEREQVDHNGDSSFATPIIQRKIPVFIGTRYRHVRIQNAGIARDLIYPPYDNRTYDPVTLDAWFTRSSLHVKGLLMSVVVKRHELCQKYIPPTPSRLFPSNVYE